MEYFIIESRYETITLDGVKFTDWFAYNTSKLTREEAEYKIDMFKKTFGYIDKKTKLKHEYRITSYDDYIEKRNQMLQNIKEWTKRDEEYKKSSEYKELQKKKRQSAKERKERQEKYINEHIKETC